MSISIHLSIFHRADRTSFPGNRREAGGVIRALLLGYTIYSSGLVLPVIFGFYGKSLRLDPLGAMVAVIGGRAVAIFDTWKGYSHFGLVGMGLSGILLFLVSWIARFLKRRYGR